MSTYGENDRGAVPTAVRPPGCSSGDFGSAQTNSMPPSISADWPVM